MVKDDRSNLFSSSTRHLGLFLLRIKEARASRDPDRPTISFAFSTIGNTPLHY
jgi:hypothetical protein